MKEKISAFIDAEILRLAKQRATAERRPVGELIQEALANYLRKFAATSEERKVAYELFCKRPMKIPREQLLYVVKEDIWNL